MRGEHHLRLSLYTVPEVCIGRCPLSPGNSERDPRRIQYLDGMVECLNGVFSERRRRGSRAAALAATRAFAARLPYAALLSIDADATPPVSYGKQMRDRLSFDHDRLKLAFLDGLNRGGMSPTIPAGRDSPELAQIVAALAHGLTEQRLSQVMARGTVDLSGAVSGLRGLGLIEACDPAESRVPAALSGGTGDRLTWLGHACMLYQTPRASVCIDPYLRPHLRWTPREEQEAFSPAYADSRYFEPYGPAIQPLSPAELPALDAVFITHQDADHCNLGVLMLLPDEVPIVVPDWWPGHPWEVDLARLLRRVLGPRRRIIRLKHGQSLQIGDLRATAFPFHGEMPSSLETRWNCYLFETERSAVACTADSAVTDAAVTFLAGQVGRRKPLVLCARPLHAGGMSPGYRDEAEELYNFTRLWAWYVPVWDLFHPVEPPGISESRLARLAAATDLIAFHPYAMGTAPWFRLPDADDPLHVPLGNLSLGELDAMADVLGSLPRRTRLFPGKFAEPFMLQTGSVARSQAHPTAA